MKPWRAILVIVVALTGATVSGFLLLQHYGESVGVSVIEEVCGEAADSGCAVVARGPYSAFHGMPLAALGLVFYWCLGLLLLLGTLGGDETEEAFAWLAFVGVLLALVVDLMLLGVQAFAIRAYCTLCIATYLLNVLALVLLLPARRSGLRLWKALQAAEGRVAVAGWLLGSVAFATAVAAADRVLGYLQAERAASVLGSPPAFAPPPPSTPAATPAPEATSPLPSPGQGAAGEPQQYQEQLRLTQKEAQRLQAILDDPKKLEEYFTEKALREFDQAATQDIDVRQASSKGPETAPIKVVEFSDFLCPYCRSLAGAFSNYMPRSGTRVILYFKHYPLDQACNPGLQNTVHAGACWLALGGVCAEEQGRFWPYHDKIFSTNLTNPQSQDVVRLGTEAGLNGAALESCLGSARAKERLAAEIKEARGLGVATTPAVFVNGKRLPRIGDFLAVLEKESARLGLPPLPQAESR